MTSRPSTAAPILAVLAVVLVTLVAYVGAYFCGSNSHRIRRKTQPEVSLRIYRFEWQCKLFQPMAWLETYVSGRKTYLRSPAP